MVRGETEVARGFEVRVLVGYDGGRMGARAIPDDLRRALSEETSSEDEVA